MALDVAAARAAVGQAALARDEEALRAIADSLPALTAYGYERHRARAFANAIRGARDSAVAELCLGVAACAPAASTFVADSAQLRLLTGEHVQAPPTTLAPRRPSPRLILSGAALAAAFAALVVLPARSFEDERRESAGITAPSGPSPPRVVVVDPPAPSRPFERPAIRADGGGEGEATLVRATVPVAPQRRIDAPPRPAAVARPRPRPAPAPTPASPGEAPAPPSEPPPAPPPAPAATPAPAAAVAPAATSRPREQKGKALGKAHAPGQLKKAAALAPPQPDTPSPEPAPLDVPAPQTPPHPGQGQGRDKTHGRGP
jgi:hypothetical protein